MYHVIVSGADALEMSLPIFRVDSHEFRNDGEHRDGGQRQLSAIQLEGRSNIYVIYGRLSLLDCSSRGIGKVV